MLNLKPLYDVLDWPYPRWQYHLAKVAHTAVLGLLLHALAVPLLAAMITAGFLYLGVGKFIWWAQHGVDHSFKEAIDVIFDGNLSAVPAALVLMAERPISGLLVLALCTAIYVYLVGSGLHPDE